MSEASMKSLRPESVRRRPALASTEFRSLLNSPDPDIIDDDEAVQEDGVDFRSLVHDDKQPLERTPPKTLADWSIDLLTPTLIFVMVYAVIFFLLDVRYIYTAVNDVPLRFVAFFFVLGVVACNRVLARDSSPDSFLIPIVFAGSIGLYTLSSSTFYDNSGSYARNFMNDAPWLATGFNMAIVAIIWWVVNRLTHECAVDENKTAGDEGILSGTARNFRDAMRPKGSEGASDHLYENASHAAFAKAQGKEFLPMNVLEAFDPSEGYKPKKKAAPKYNLDRSQRLSKRHPGISIFYFSVPAMLIFTLGIRVVQQGGPSWVAAGHFYAGIYTAATLLLLMLTSLGGLRQYFSARKIAMPAPMGYFWMGLGVVMTAMVMLAATQVHRPDLPPMAIVEAHEQDAWAGPSKFRLASTAAKPMELLEQSIFMERLGQSILGLFGLFALYGLLKLGATAAAGMARQRHLFPGFVVRFFDGLERLLSLMTSVPSIPRFRRVQRIDRSLATCAEYTNSLAEPEGERTLPDHVTHAYDALCALAHDMGVPREADQTPFEFIDAFPRPLRNLKKQARELTELYVQAAYSQKTLDGSAENTVRRFWIAYERTRKRVLK
jgi:hypothetical protein